MNSFRNTRAAGGLVQAGAWLKRAAAAAAAVPHLLRIFAEHACWKYTLCQRALMKPTMQPNALVVACVRISQIYMLKTRWLVHVVFWLWYVRNNEFEAENKRARKRGFEVNAWPNGQPKQWSSESSPRNE